MGERAEVLDATINALSVTSSRKEEVDRHKRVHARFRRAMAIRVTGS